MTLTPNVLQGRYRIAGRIGVGGMGQVYRAHDISLNRDVAVKVISDDAVPDSATLRRFAREAEALSALNHPNIVTVFDVGDCESGPFIVMELVDGRTLRSVLDDENWADDLRGYRDQLGGNPGVPLWLVIGDHEVLGKGFGASQWRGTVLPQIRSLVR